MSTTNILHSKKIKRIDSCETVVIGAGLVGAALARNLASEGLDVAVLEAQDIASGATQHTTGLVLTGLATPYAQIIQDHGHETARALWQMTVDNQAQLTSAADRLGVALERTESLALATDVATTALLKNSAEMLVADGFEAQFEAQDPLRRGFKAALSCPDAVTLDIVTLTQRLLQGIPTHTGTEVYSLEQDGENVLVLARGRTVKASTVILAVNAYAPMLDHYFADKIAPAHSYILTTQPLEKDLVSKPGCAYAERPWHSPALTSFRQDRDRRLCFTACRPHYEMPAAGPDDKGTEVELMRFVGRYFPEAVPHLAGRHSRMTGVSRDGLPIVGALPHLPQVFFAVGLGHYGLSLSFAVADLLTSLIVRGAEPALLSARRLE
jgi:gamma-glutamylputrescine oxidase